MPGGEQLKTDRWSQTKVNSIRRPERASLLVFTKLGMFKRSFIRPKSG